MPCAPPPARRRAPADLGSGCAWYPASVPGTFAAALREAGEWNGETPLELDDVDVWYRTRFSGAGPETLRFEGLATISDIWMNGAHLLHTDNMFRPYAHRYRRVVATMNSLYASAACAPGCTAKRTCALAHTARGAIEPALRPHDAAWPDAGLVPTVHPVGPWQPVLRQRWNGSFRLRCHRCARNASTMATASSPCAANCGATCRPAFSGLIEVGGQAARLEPAAPNSLAGVTQPSAYRALVAAHARRAHIASSAVGYRRHGLRSRAVGFRRVEIDRGADGNGFGLRVNGEAVFCRGACWTTPDLVSLASDAASCRPLLEEMRDAGLNMVRIAGTMLYGSDEFYALCDELGLLVWQDAMLASFDYPATSGVSLHAERGAGRVR